MIAWRTDLYLVTLVHSVVQTCRAATRGIVAQNSDLIPMTFRRAIAQRVLPDKAARYVHVDMGARFERRQLASIEAGKFETDNTLGLRTPARNAHRKPGMIHDSRPYMIDKPPSTISVVPVMNDASSLANQRIGQAISSGVAHRPINDVSCR